MEITYFYDGKIHDWKGAAFSFLWNKTQEKLCLTHRNIFQLIQCSWYQVLLLFIDREQFLAQFNWIYWLHLYNV